MAKKTFDFDAVMSLSTGRLLTTREGPRDNGFGKMHELVEHMVGEPTFTHQLPRVAKECESWLKRWFPVLEKLDSLLPELDAKLEALGGATNQERSDAVQEWRDEAADRLGIPLSFEVDGIPADDHESRNPIEELVEMVGADKVAIATADMD